MTRLFVFVAALTGIVVLATCDLTRRTPGTCANDDECGDNEHCSMMSPNRYHCVSADGGTLGCVTNGCPVGGPPRCDPDTSECVECIEKGDVSCTSPKGACDTDAKKCVECTIKDDCTGTKAYCDELKTCVQCLDDAGCGGTTPICETKACRACKTDSECVETGVCMEDGHRAAATEVVYVKKDLTICSNTGAGTAAQPFCTPQAGVGFLTEQRPVLRLEGPTVLGPAQFSGVAFPVVVVGKSDAVINPGSDAGIALSAGSRVTARTLKIDGGAGSLGVSVDGGAELHMDRCVVANNVAGGIFVNGANYDITNTIIVGNGPGNFGAVTWGGVYIGTVPSSGVARFLNNTVVNNKPVGLSCVTAEPVVGSIIFGNLTGDGSGCTITACCSGDPSLTSDYRLQAGSLCIDKLDPTVSAPVDIDGQARPTGTASDCGADEFSQ